MYEFDISDPIPNWLCLPSKVCRSWVGNPAWWKTVLWGAHLSGLSSFHTWNTGFDREYDRKHHDLCRKGSFLCKMGFKYPAPKLMSLRSISDEHQFFNTHSDHISNRLSNDNPFLPPVDYISTQRNVHSGFEIILFVTRYFRHDFFSSLSGRNQLNSIYL